MTYENGDWGGMIALAALLGGGGWGGRGGFGGYGNYGYAAPVATAVAAPVTMAAPVATSVAAPVGYGYGYGGNCGGDRCTERQLETLAMNVESRFNNLSAQVNNNEQLEFQRDIMDHICMTDRNVDSRAFELAAMGKDGLFQTNRNIDQLRFDEAKEFCAVKEDIMGIRFQNQRDTDRIIENQNRIACEAQMREMSAIIHKQQTELSEARVIRAVTDNVVPPRPIPAYAAANPYDTYIAPTRLVPPAPVAMPYFGYGCGTPTVIATAPVVTAPTGTCA